MEPRNARLTARVASELALLGAMAATWWVPSRRVRIPILALTVAIELPAIATGAVAAAIVVEVLLLAALIATPFDHRAPLAQYEHRRLSVVL